MIVNCHNCPATYNVDPLKIPAKGVRTLCKACHVELGIYPPPAIELTEVKPNRFIELLKEPNFQRTILGLASAAGVVLDPTMVSQILAGFLALSTVIYGFKTRLPKKG